MKATEVTAGLAESNGSLLPGLWRDSLHVTCGMTACTPGSALGPTLGNVEYGKTLPFLIHNALGARGIGRPADVRTFGGGVGWSRGDTLGLYYSVLSYVAAC